ncbi:MULTISPECIES: rhodanese-like domain-containing protein [Acidithiobacillus]|jgi:rhodanese-related sulfurtransferase|nr:MULTISPECIES: rhodanese-like domain-containing protein [Acidithiobacillus]MBN6743075.1 rhodanese-like domain-containing protein [Acidithiobacillus sp. MC6.1]MBU2767331.1 rhodanese-like domain-containing protein [Acidithiobacillus ferrivorans]MBU2849581.1 rhodanese-like domain-containing protein [Acidithiobacillus ferrivorans]OCB03077.1 sulfurtransferase [Acidithiobacillus ferrivorans]OFA15806.1 sulfurtransferase [Acidithiobacillus ferrivorans]
MITKDTTTVTPTIQGELIEISVLATLELSRLNVACLIDVRQKFELEIEGEINGAYSLPLFKFKHLLGHKLTQEEQEILDEDSPGMEDIQNFITMINDLHNAKDCIVVCVCNSGKRSINAARLLRMLGYNRAFSLVGGYRAIREAMVTDLPLAKSGELTQ